MKLPRPILLYGALLVALAVSFVVPQGSLLGLPVVLRFLAATALAFAPIFLANLVFAQRFKDVASSTTAFGASLLGAIVGGVLEYLSLITGFRFLLVVVAVLYGLAFAFGRRHLAIALLRIERHVVIALEVHASDVVYAATARRAAVIGSATDSHWQSVPPSP